MLCINAWGGDRTEFNQARVVLVQRAEPGMLWVLQGWGNVSRQGQ